MITHITIDNFMLVEHLELELNSGMTAITGETGTGKSLLLDALGIVLGARTSGDCVRLGADKATITANFTPPANAVKWLEDQGLNSHNECIINRTVTQEGRSRSTVNGHSVTQAQVRALGEMLVDIHSQHAHQSLLKKEHQRHLLDDYGNHHALVSSVKQHYLQWQELSERLHQLHTQTDEQSARQQLLSYQVAELDQLDLSECELETLEQQQTTLANSEQILQESHFLLALYEDESGLMSQLHLAKQKIAELQKLSGGLTNASNLLHEAAIQIDEAQNDLRQFVDRVECDPSELHRIEQRLSTIYDTARKHRVEPESLPELHQRLAEELATLNNSGQDLETLEHACIEARRAYDECANKLSQKRIKIAKQLSQKVNQLLHELSMKDARLTIDINPNPEQAKQHGIDHIEFLISTNPGLPAKELHKVASGGELSRISLAIEVITAESCRIPTLVFDEVDVGIGGATALVVGKLLATLGQKCQVFCVTHLAQVASFAKQHWQVQKQTKKKQTYSTIKALTGQQQIEEIARMISGDQLSQQSLAHAEQMLGHGLH